MVFRTSSRIAAPLLAGALLFPLLAAPPQPPIPDIVASPTELAVQLPPDSGATLPLTLRNTGQAALEWDILETRNGIQTAVDPRLLPAPRGPQALRYPGIRLAKGEADFRKGAPVTETIGGPDAFGHRFIDSNTPGGPLFSWTDIRATGTPVPLGDDDFAMVDLPFPVPFYGAPQNTMRISSNGYLTFGPDATAFSNTELPNPDAPNHLIAPFWTDLNPSAGSGEVHYLIDATAGLVVVQYTNVRGFGGINPFTFQVRIESNGTIHFLYLDMRGNTVQSTVGIENADGSDGLQVAFNTPYIEDSLAVSIRPGISWLSASPAGGSLAAGDSATVDVAVSAAGLSPGSYSGYLDIYSNDPDENPLRIPVRLQVGAPDIAVSPDTLDFGRVPLGTLSTRNLVVRNAGLQSLLVSDLRIEGSGATRFSLNDPTPVTLAPGDSLELPVRFVPADTLPVAAALLIASNDPDENPFTVPLTGSGSVPLIDVRPAALVFDTTIVDSTTAAAVQVRNGGSAPLTLAVTRIAGVNAAEFAITSGGAPAVVMPGDSHVVALRFTPAAAGVREAALSLISDAVNMPLVTVPLSGVGRLALRPRVRIAPDSLAFGTVALGDSLALPVRVFNDGGAALDLLSATVSGPGAVAFAIRGTVPAAIPSGDSLDLTVRFRPDAPGMVAATLEIATSDPDTPLSRVPLTGSGELGPNRAPVIDPIADQTVPAGGRLVVPIRATDPDGDGLVFAGTNLPGFVALFDSGDGTGSITIAPGGPDAGVYPGVRVIVWDTGDPVLADTAEFQLTVIATNTAPQIDPVADIRLSEGDTLVVSLRATDADGDSLLFSGFALPPFATLTDSGNGRASLTVAPGYLAGGSYPDIGVVVRDDGAPSLSDTARFSLTVDDVPDTERPVCRLLGIDNGPPKVARADVRDAMTGIARIEVEQAVNCVVVIDSFVVGTTDPVSITATQIDSNRTSVVVVRVFDGDGNHIVCDPVVATLLAGVPGRFDLKPAYPNPFNPTTTIEFDLPEGELTVGLRVYDLTGRLVRVLVDDRLEAGSYRVVWDGTSDRGASVASGMYIVRMRAGDQVRTRRVVLMK